MPVTSPVSSGWITLTRPTGTILPWAVAMMSIWPKVAQASAITKKAISVPPRMRPSGDAGVSTISSAAGRNSSRSRRACARRERAASHGSATTLAASLSLDMVNPRLHPMHRGVAAAGAKELLVAAVLDDAAALERDDAVGHRYGRKPVRDDQHRAAL